jgi:SAM-dependent methyltransferase
MNRELLNRLRCPICFAPFDGASPSDGSHLIRCAGQGHVFPVVDGIARFVDTVQDSLASRTQASFGYEWTHFTDWRSSGETNFNDYFAGLDLGLMSSAVVLDAGCGMGRHSRLMATRAGRVVAVDFSRAIDQARRNTADVGNVDCVQADLFALPFADGTFDLVYSLGVLHHLTDTERALRQLVAKLKPGGRLRIYLYWKRHGWKGTLLAGVTAARQVTTRMPFPALRAFCAALSVGLFGGIVLPYRALSFAGVKAIEEWPLFVYSKYPFNVLFNDQFDRFSAPIEKRYDPHEVRQLLEHAGLIDVTVQACYGWIGDGIKPA